MTKKQLMELYEKERNYQAKMFGNFEKSEHLNIASFIHFVERYLSKAKSSYVTKWNSDIPKWLLDCREHGNGTPVPSDTYSYLVKVFALTGAALEACVIIDPAEWRKDSSEKFE